MFVKKVLTGANLALNLWIYLVNKIVLQVRCIKIKRLFQKIVDSIVAGREEKLAGSYN